MSSKLIKSQVSIIGAGPVGLTAAHLLEKAGISYKIIERQTKQINHPAAHLVNLRSMEVFDEINLGQKIIAQTEDQEYFRYYRYLRRIFEPNDQQYAVHDHFYPNIPEKLREISTHSFSKYVHLPQTTLVQLLGKQIIEPEEHVLLGHQVEKIINPRLRDPAQNQVELTVKELANNENKTIQSDFLIACDGFHSFVRKQQGVQMVGNDKNQGFLNIYFHSKKLADQMIEHDQNAMLHFIFNSDITACLVNHTKHNGMFVLQVPVYPPFSDLIDYKMPQEEKYRKAMIYINNILDSKFQVNENDVDIKNVGVWYVANMQIENYYKNRIIFAGDSAHGFPPAGGFGMNTGIHEIHGLVHSLRRIYGQKIQYDGLEVEKVLNNFNRERQAYVQKVINETMKQYRNSYVIAKKLGLSRDNLLVAHNLLDRMPFAGKTTKLFMWNKLLKVGTYHLELDNHVVHKKENLEYLKNQDNLIPMIYYEHDVGFSYPQGYMDSNRQLRKKHQKIGYLLPHFYIKLKELYGSGTVSSRQMANYLEEKDLISVNRPEIFYQNNVNQNERQINYFVAYYMNESWESKKEELAKYIDSTFEYLPNLVYGVQLNFSQEKGYTNDFNKNEIIDYCQEDHETGIINEQKFSEYQENLKETIGELFKTREEIILVRSDSIIYGIYDQEDIIIQ